MTRPPRILYIDDDAAFARLAARALERAGYAVEQATSGAAGLRRMAEEQFDAVALDHHMPGVEGLDVLKEIRRQPSPPPVIYVTGSEASHIAVSALKAGAADYVWKDVQGHFRELLVEAVSNALTQEKLRHDKDEADREVRAARDRAELLLKEVNHRLANSLALVASFARMQAAHVSDPAARAALDAMQARVHAIAGVHRRLYTSDNVDSVALDQYLAALVVDIEQSLLSETRNLGILYRGEPLRVTTDRAVSIGIVATELVTNACKYAYPEGMRGEIRLRLWSDGGSGHLSVSDDGIGLGEAPKPGGTGVGSRIVRTLAAGLGAMRYEAGPGVTAVLSFPLETGDAG